MSSAIVLFMNNIDLALSQETEGSVKVDISHIGILYPVLLCRLI